MLFGAAVSLPPTVWDGLSRYSYYSGYPIINKVNFRQFCKVQAVTIHDLYAAMTRSFSHICRICKLFQRKTTNFYVFF